MKIRWSTGIGYLECCALLHAFINNPDTVAAQSLVHGTKKVRMCADILVHSLFLTIPAELMAVYGALADAEQRRLDSGDIEPFKYCRNQVRSSTALVHTRQEHRNALRLFMSFSRPRYSGSA